MKKPVFAALLATALSVGGFASSTYGAGIVPCEDMLKDVRATAKSAKLSDADMKKVTDLETKGVERCNADDDKRADGFLADALKIMGK
jgi:hypothetical protein